MRQGGVSAEYSPVGNGTGSVQWIGVLANPDPVLTNTSHSVGAVIMSTSAHDPRTTRSGRPSPVMSRSESLAPAPLPISHGRDSSVNAFGPYPLGSAQSVG